MRVGPRHPEADGLHFASDAEHKVYAVLKAKQESLPAEDTLGIAPLPGLRVRQHTFEPGLLVLYQGRAGVIEVDGPHHTGRRAADASREGLLRNAGVAHVDRIDVRGTTSRADVEQFIERGTLTAPSRYWSIPRDMPFDLRILRWEALAHVGCR